VKNSHFNTVLFENKNPIFQKTLHIIHPSLPHNTAHIFVALDMNILNPPVQVSLFTKVTEIDSDFSAEHHVVLVTIDKAAVQHLCSVFPF